MESGAIASEARPEALVGVGKVARIRIDPASPGELARRLTFEDKDFTLGILALADSDLLAGELLEVMAA